MTLYYITSYCVYASIASYSVFNAFSRCIGPLCGLKYGQNIERQSLFDKGLVNTEKWGPAPKNFSEQEVDSVKY